MGLGGHIKVRVPGATIARKNICVMITPQYRTMSMLQVSPPEYKPKPEPEGYEIQRKKVTLCGLAFSQTSAAFLQFRQ